MALQVPEDWLSEAEIIRATGVTPRNLAQWRAEGIVVGRRRSLGRGAGTTPCFYPPDTPALIQRLFELQSIVRDADWWVWQLRQERFSADIRKWAMWRLRGAIKLANRAGPAGVAEAALRAAEARTGGSGSAGGFFARVRKPAHREAFFSWVAATLAGYEQQANIHNAEPPIFEIALKAMGIPRSNLPPPKINFSLLSAHWFHQILATLDHHEEEQAWRDWRAIGHVIEALKNTDWNAAGRELEAKIADLTESRLEPQSKRDTKARGQRPHARPAIFDVFIEGFSDLKVRPYLFALFVAIRRSSPENSNTFSQCIALVTSMISSLPQRPSTTPPGAAP